MDHTPETIEETLFHQALALETPAARAAFLDEACRGNDALRQTLEQLLEGHFSGEGFLTRLPGRSPHGQQPPQQLDGKYELRERIGEGGFGEVWRAEQLAPVRRPVAIKILKAGMDTRQLVARFDAERQALAMMDHPNIAKVFDAGATATGRPYFVMEVVRGIRVTEYCDQHNLSTPERLSLFITVCHAIQHAHQKGVIHRDIKPSNILVTTHDGRPAPKVIDFGIAKATEASLDDVTFQTQWHQFIGTPAYVSPEQAELRATDVDTRSDIYSLGVLLYELLVGVTPFDGKKLSTSGIDEMRRTIRETEPARPSVRFAALGADQRMEIARRRATDPSMLKHQLQGDLDWIVMKCLEKDRARRYETANALAADLERHLKNEPVTARPPSATYRLQKFYRRNRLGVVASAVVALALVIAAAVSGWSFVREKQARLAEQQQRERAEAALADAAAQRDAAQQLLLDSLLREMRATTTIRRFGYRRELLARVSQALELPQAPQRIASIRTEFMRGLGDPVGLEPRVLPWQDPAEASSIVATAVSLDGTTAATWTPSTGLVIHDTATGARLARFDVERPPWLRFSRDGRSVFGYWLTPDEARDPADPFVFHVGHWTLDATGVWTARATPWPRAVVLLATSSGVLAMAPGGNGAAVLRNLETGSVVAHLPPELVRLSAVTDFGVKRGLLALGNAYMESTAIDIFQVADASRQARLEPAAGMGRFTSVRFSPDERLILCTAEDGAMIFETSNFREVHRVFGGMNPYGGIFVQNGTAVVIPEAQRPALRVLALPSGTQTEIQTRGVVRFLGTNLDGSTLMFADEAGLNFVRLTDTRERRRFAGHAGGVTAVEFSPDGTLLATAGKDGSIRLWDTNSGELRHVIQRAGALPQAVQFSPGGRWLAVGDYLDEQIHILYPDTGERLFTVGESKPGRTWACAFSPDGQKLFAVGGTVRAWYIARPANAAAEENINDRPVFEEKQFIAGRNVQIDPSGRWLACTGLDRDAGRLFIGRADAPGAIVAAAEGISGRVQTLQFVPGREELAFLVTTPETRELRFLRLGANRVVRQISLLLPGERVTAQVDNLRFSPDGTCVAIANADGRAVDIIDVASGRRLYTLPDEPGVVWWLAWHPDGRRLAIARESGDVSLWNLTEVESALREARLDP